MDFRSSCLDAISKSNQVLEEFSNSLDIRPSIIPILPAQPPSGDHTAPAGGLPFFIAEKLDFDLEIARIDGLSLLMAYFLRWENPDKARIVYSSILNRCWSRFLICKELSHSILGTSKNLTSTAEGINKILTLMLNDEARFSSSDPALIVESSAYYAAVEMLIPRFSIPDIQEMFDYGCTNIQVARTYLCPESIIEFRFQDDAKAFFEEAYSRSPSIIV